MQTELARTPPPRDCTIPPRVRIVGSATYLQDRARRRLSRGMLLAIGGIGLLLFGLASGEFFGADSPFVLTSLPAFLGLGSALIGALQFTASRRDAASGAGETPVLAQLRARLDDSYAYLRRVTMPGRSVEADGVLVGPHGVLVLAIRAVDGTFAVRGNDWFVVDAAGKRTPWARSPTWELARPLRVVQRALLEEGFGDVPVQAAVVLVRGKLLEADQPAAAVVPVDKIGNYVDYLRPETPIVAELVEQVAEILEPYAPAETQPA